MRTGMCNRVHAARRAQRSRQRHGQVNIIDDCAWQDLGVAARRLLAVGRLAQDGRHLAARIRRRDADMRQAGPDRNGLPQTDSAAAANGYDAVGLGLLGVGKRIICDVRRRMHGGLGIDAGGGNIALGEQRLQRLGLRDLLRRAEEERCGYIEARELSGDLLQRARSEDDATWVGIVLEWLHHGGENVEGGELMAAIVEFAGSSFILYAMEVEQLLRRRGVGFHASADDDDGGAEAVGSQCGEGKDAISDKQPVRGPLSGLSAVGGGAPLQRPSLW